METDVGGAVASGRARAELVSSPGPIPIPMPVPIPDDSTALLLVLRRRCDERRLWRILRVVAASNVAADVAAAAAPAPADADVAAADAAASVAANAAVALAERRRAIAATNTLPQARHTDKLMAISNKRPKTIAKRKINISWAPFMCIYRLNAYICIHK